ncbi:MAG: hypothetical protein LBD25_02685 [Coriobacteriales bacterium]|jgi:hypothetical protein|nr:hypothetical protein [Coriobacteriales bacterium]
MRKLFERFPILKYLVVSFAKTFVAAFVILGVAFAVLAYSGIYFQIEAALDLKYNSPIVQAPLIVFPALAVVCGLIGTLLYYHKYKRTKSSSAFGKAFAGALDTNKGDKK